MHGTGMSAMGKGGDLIAVDEAGRVTREQYAKLVRLLGDDPVNSTLIEMYNPFNRDSVAFDHSISPRFERIEIDYKIGIQEGRTTQAFVDEQREDMTPLEFCILYLSKFPDESEDSLYKLSKIEQAENVTCNFEKNLLAIEKVLLNPEKYSEIIIKKYKTELKKYTRIISCDPADKGMDWTVIFWGVQYLNKYQITGWYSEPKSESTEIVGRIYNKVITFIGHLVPGKINLDRIGVGVGPLSTLKERMVEGNYKNVQVIGCHFGEAAPQLTITQKANFANKKAENYFRNAALFNSGFISIPKDVGNKNQKQGLKSQLLSMKWGFNSSAQKKIIDPEKSPDYGDGCCYFTWQESVEQFGVLETPEGCEEVL